MLICCCGYGVAQIWFAYAQTELMIILARMFAGLFTGGVFVSFLTYVVSVARPEDQGKYLTYTATIKSVAGAFGYLVGGFLGEISVRLSFLAQAGLLITVAVLFFFICQPDSTTSLKEISAGQLVREANPFQAFIDSRKFMTVAFALLFAVNIFTNFGNTGFDQALQLLSEGRAGPDLLLQRHREGPSGLHLLRRQHDHLHLDHQPHQDAPFPDGGGVGLLPVRPGSDRLLQHRPCSSSSAWWSTPAIP